MSLDIDNFQDLMGQVDNFVAQASAMQASLANQKHRELFDTLFSKIREARAEAETAVPAAINALNQRKEEVKAQLKQLEEEIPKRKKERQDLAKKAKEVAARREEDKKKLKAKPPKVNLAKVKMPQGWGDQLKDELLNKFGNLPVAPSSAPRDAAIWDDWHWGGEAPGGKEG